MQLSRRFSIIYGHAKEFFLVRDHLSGDDRLARMEFSGGWLESGRIFRARNLWERLCSWFRRLRRPDKAYQNQDISSESEREEKRGRPTTPDNFLVGARNAWVWLLEESWPEIGLALISIRKRKKSSIQDIQTALTPARGKGNGGLVTNFVHTTVDMSDTAQVRQGRKDLFDLAERIREVGAEVSDADWRCNETINALLQPDAGPGEKEIVEDETTQRCIRLIRLRKKMFSLEQEAGWAAEKLADQEAYVSQSQLLDYLQSGRYAVEPLSIGNAMAGLPLMGWRQSYDRCSAMPYETESHFNYRLLQAVVAIWDKRPERSIESPADFFKAGILSLPKSRGSIRDHVRKYWRDFRVSIEECSKTGYSDFELPFALTRIFIASVLKQKSLAEQILSQREELSDRES
jgi:hypothetical protein